MSTTVQTDPDVGANSSCEYSVVKGILTVLAVVVFADISLYRGHGFSGIAAFLVVTSGLLGLGVQPQRSHRSLSIVAGMLVLVGVRLVWFGSPLLAAVGLVLLFAFVTSLHGHTPYLFTVLNMASQTVVAGGRALWEFQGAVRGGEPKLKRQRSLTVVLPVLAFVVFGTLFILANPDAVTFVGRQLQQFLSSVSEWFVHLALRPTEIVFWAAIAWISAGLLRPILILPLTPRSAPAAVSSKTADAPLYPAFRNTLFTVIGLFAAYLIYEFYSLWSRDFPEGFYYAGYAHEGAAWLTAALALATLTLSLIFANPAQNNSRLPSLRLLAWIWSLQNLLLSLAVYNRLFIYIDFNGMTRMRIVGLFGITVVVAGFCLVVWKITRGKTFSWLVQRQIWALAAAVYLFAILPADGIAATYNVRRILDGRLSACMQIGVQPLDLEGVLAILPLLDCPAAEIREGVAALVAEQYLQLRDDRQRRRLAGWTAYQVSDDVAVNRLEAVRGNWRKFESDEQRKAALRRFHNFAYQWY